MEPNPFREPASLPSSAPSREGARPGSSPRARKHHAHVAKKHAQPTVGTPTRSVTKVVNSKFAAYVVVYCAVFVGGIFIGMQWHRSTPQYRIKPIHAGQSKLINPLIIAT